MKTRSLCRCFMKWCLSVAVFLCAQAVGADCTASSEAETEAINRERIAGTVRDSAGGALTSVVVSLQNSQGTIAGTTRTNGEGRFEFLDVVPGTYVLVIDERGFEPRRRALTVPGREHEEILVELEPAGVAEQVTVTANPGMVESVESLTQQVNIIGEPQIEQRAKAVTGQVATEEAGVQWQRTSPSISGIFVRGLTGNKVNVFVDGVRYSTSAMRGGINTFLNLIDPTNLQTVEILRGSNSAQYGSDAIGGSVQFLTQSPVLTTGAPDFRGKWAGSFGSADVSWGSNLTTTYGTKNFGVLANIAGRRINRLRPGEGIDSRNAVTRFLGLSSTVVIGERLPDTGFTEYGGLAKLEWAPAPGSQLVLSYSRSQQDGGRRYDQLIGGDGNLIADLRNLMLDLFYVRYDKIKLGWFDGFTASYSFNAQREERVNQGGNGNPLASIAHEPERTAVNGIQAFANKVLGSRNHLVIGGEYHHEHIDAPSFAFDPVTGRSSIRRGRVPDQARYQSGGLFAQDAFEALPGKMRLVGNVRYSAASYGSSSLDSPLVDGKPLWPDDSLVASSVTFRIGLVVTPVDGLSLLANISRGFRAPHVTDLGTLGLTGSGFEVAAPDVAGLGATVGSTASISAVSTGVPVSQVEPETSLSYEVGARYRSRRVDANFAFFVNDISDNITKQALILPPGAVGLRLGDQTIASQNANGVVFVEASPSPVLVRANFDEVRIYGFEQELDLRITPGWTFGAVYTYLHARDKRTDLPPNIEGGTPAPEAYFTLRYEPAGTTLWVEPYVHAAWGQDRLSSLDLDDRRIGAGRTRSSIANFFNNGARFRGLVSAGPDGVPGNSDDVLIPTDETLVQVQDRVLGPGIHSGSLFTRVPGYVTLNVRAGFRIGERHRFLLDLENIADRNYRGISWGLDAAGRGVYARYSISF